MNGRMITGVVMVVIFMVTAFVPMADNLNNTVNVNSSRNAVNNNTDNVYRIGKKYIKPYWSVLTLKPAGLQYNKLTLLNYHNTGNTAFIIAGNSNIIMYCEYIYHNSTVTSKLFMNVKHGGSYIVLFNALSSSTDNNNYTSMVSNSNINLNGIDISGNHQYIVHQSNHNLVESSPYYFYGVPSNGSVYIDPVIKPATTYYGKYTWSLSGNTQVSNSDILSGGNIKLSVGVTSYSASSSNPTTLDFMVSNSTENECVNSVSVGGTGTYSYNWHSNLNGNVHFYAKYISYCYYRPCQPTSNSYSNIGGSNFKVTKYLNYMGYDGNNVIYLSTHASLNEKIYGNEYSNSSSTFNSNAGHYCFGNNSIIAANTRYTTLCTDGTSGIPKFNIDFNLSAVGAARQYCIYPASGKQVTQGPAKQIIEIKTNNAPSNEHTYINSHYARGFNVTNTYSKNNNMDKGINALILSGLGLIPVAGYFVTGLSAACAISSIINGIHPNSYANATDNNLASTTFYINGGSRIDTGKYYNDRGTCEAIGQNVFATGINSYIKIPMSELTKSFTIAITYYDKYASAWYPEYSNSLETQTATTTQTIHAVTSSAIYGSILNSNLSTDKTNTSLYLENVNNGNHYKTHVKNGYFLFFAQPNTEYKIYNKNDNLLYTINSSKLTAGNSFHLRLPSSSV